MKIVKDLRTLKAISKKYNFTYNKKYKYLENYNNDLYFKNIVYNNKNYDLQFFSGCFNPYLVEVAQNEK